MMALQADPFPLPNEEKEIFLQCAVRQANGTVEQAIHLLFISPSCAFFLAADQRRTKPLRFSRCFYTDFHPGVLLSVCRSNYLMFPYLL